MPAAQSISNLKFKVSNFLRSHGNGFTLIELMIAVGIIGIISAIGMVGYSQAQKLARDARRKQDLRSIAIALELYYQKNSHYPTSAVGGWQYSSGANPWITGTPVFGTNYINTLPKDPLGNDANPLNANSYGYAYYSGTSGAIACNANDQNYQLVTRLENTSDSDRCEIKNYQYCGGSLCGPGGTHPLQSFVITN